MFTYKIMKILCNNSAINKTKLSLHWVYHKGTVIHTLLYLNHIHFHLLFTIITHFLLFAVEWLYSFILKSPSKREELRKLSAWWMSWFIWRIDPKWSYTSVIGTCKLIKKNFNIPMLTLVKWIYKLFTIFNKIQIKIR